MIRISMRCSTQAQGRSVTSETRTLIEFAVADPMTGTHGLLEQAAAQPAPSPRFLTSYTELAAAP